VSSRDGTQGRPLPERGFQLGPGVWTRLRYTAWDAEGELVAGMPSEVGVVFGFGMLLPAVEQKIEGLVAGEKKSFELRPEDAYGARDPKAQIEFDRAEFPEDIAEGDRYEVERDDGTPLVLQVLAVSEEGVLVDLNHPLAGQRVRFEVEVLEVRAASGDELTLAEAALMGDEDGESDPGSGPEDRPEGLVPVASLLRRGVRS
jgi:FKBP-type peptidyl-prolyl cis-trans isomerase SlyD